MKLVQTGIRIRLIQLLACIITFSHSCVQAEDQTVRDKLDRLAANIHGFANAGEDEQAALKAFLVSEASKIINIAEEVSARISDVDYFINNSIYVENIISLSIAADRVKGLTLCRRRIQDATLLLRVLENEFQNQRNATNALIGDIKIKYLGAVLDFRIHMINCFYRSKDSMLIDEAKIYLEAADVSTVYVSCRYLLLFTEGDMALKEFLKLKYSDPSSKCFKHFLLNDIAR